MEDQKTLQVIQDEPKLPPALLRNVCFYTPPPDGSKPTYITLDMKKDGVRNYPHHEANIIIRDIRGREEDFTLDTHGFRAMADSSVSTIDFSNKQEVEAVYAPKVEKLLLDHLEGTFKVVVFDTTIRRAANSELFHRPVRKIHIDQSARGAYLRANQSLSIEYARKVGAGELRFRIVNVWKPLNGPVVDHPLIFADSTTVREEDLYNQATEFWFWSSMSTSELVLLQYYNSITLKTRCEHGSFNLSGSKEETFTRSSVELRCLVLG
ncbi:hypothetical protein BKA64DRAFT_698366 [Cadophora sp. MPI-SDFR-AT-0126]|nr:hypothetical protein BKA64DRAFT_698366 [Leotiomycetes sp. MPI-SDFR-AT-0126]